MTLETAVVPVDIDRIRMWHNARTKVDQAELEQLAASLLDTGGAIHFPMGYWVNDEVELVAGERRWRAYRLLRDRGHGAFSQLPVRMIERPSAKDAHKWALVENVQRVDLRPSELAAELVRMLELSDEVTGRAVWSRQSLAEDIGKDATFVSRMLAMHRAPVSVMAAVDEGRCSLEVGSMIGSLPPEMREGAASEMVTGPMGAMTQAAAREWLGDRYRRSLRTADFTTEAVGLAGEPACVKCDWWGGNREDVAGKNAVHVCLNPACFGRKQRAALESAVEAAPRVMSEVEAAGVFESHSGRIAPESGWVDLAESPSPLLLADGARSGVVIPKWGELLRDAGVEVTVTWDGSGARRSMVESGVAIRAAVASRWGTLFREGVANEHLSRDERAADRHAKAAGDREWRAAISEGLCELHRGLQSAQDWEHVVEASARVALEAMCKGEDLTMLAEVLGVQGSEARTAEMLSVALSGMPGRDLGAALAVLLLVRRVRYEGFACLVQEDGAPMAELCRMASFDAAAWSRTAKRRKGAAERGGRE